MMDLIQLDIVGIIKQRLGRRSKWLPAFALRPLERIIRQRELNAMLRAAYPEEGSGFSRRILEHLEIRVEVEGLDCVPGGEPLVFASNHPLGGLDGIALVSVLGERYGDDRVRVVVNDMLMHVAPLAGVFLPVNKYGAQGRRAAALLNESLAAGRHVVMFPAGLVSRLGDDGRVADLEWQKAFVQKALDYGRRIVPVRFEAANRPRFYRLARLRKRLGIRVNLEQATLPAELCATRGKTFRITFLPAVDPSGLRDAGESTRDIAARIRRLVCG